MLPYRKVNSANWIFAVLILCVPVLAGAQTTPPDSLLDEVTLENAVAYALERQPAIQQAKLDEEVTATQVRSKLADWYPQVNFNYNLQHNFVVPTTQVAGNIVRLGANNTSSAQFTVSQTLFKPDALLAKKSQADVIQQSQQSTASKKIDLAVNVTKAFYEVLSTMQQIDLAESNIERIERSLKDANNQYIAGLTDKIDYKRATIALNNAKANQQSNEALLIAKVQQLKSLMNYPDVGDFNIVYDSLAMENEILLDTTQLPDYRERIEYKQLETQRKLLETSVSYNKWTYLPTISANGAYNFNFQNNEFSKLYNVNYPSSFANIALVFPLFQGGRRSSNLAVSEMALRRNELDLIYLKTAVNAAYAQSIAIYKSNYIYYLTLRENVALAKEVYDVVELQYRSGIKTYLEVITAETDLRLAQISYFNALYQVLAAKIDVQKALGQINY